MRREQPARDGRRDSGAIFLERTVRQLLARGSGKTG
jgi:hypothetical protein